MRKLSVKIAIILFALLITIIAAISTLVFLVNSGKLTHFIERRIKTDTNFDIKIEDIHLGIFSDLQLKHISVKWLSDQEQFTLECNALTIRYKPFDLLNRRIKGVDLSDVQIVLNAEKEKAIKPPTSDGYKISSFNIKDYYPEHLLIEDFSVNNTKVKITTGGYAFTLTEMSMQAEEIQPATPFGISINGNFSISNRANTTSPNLLGKIDVNTKYSLPDDELIILDGSYFLVNDLEKFSINGKVCSITSLPEINCKISLCGLPMNNIPGLLSDFNFMNSPSLILGGEYDLNLSVQGNFNKLKLNSNNLIKSLSLKIEKTVFKANMLEIPIEVTLSPSDPKSTIEANGKFVVHKGHLQVPNGQITTIDLLTAFTLDYPNQITLSSNDIHGKLHYVDTLYSIDKLISNIKSNIDLKLPESIQFQVQIDTMFSDTAHIMGNVDMKKNVIRDTTLKIHNINGKSLSETFKSMIPENYKDWSLNGNISVNTIINTTIDYAEKDKPQIMTAITDLSLSKLGFASPDYDYFAEDINGQIKINLSTDRDFRKISFNTDSIVDPFLVQLGKFTTDMRSRKTHLSLNGNYDIQKNNLNGVKTVLSWNNLGTLTALGDILSITDNLHLDMNIELKNFENAAFFETFVKDTVEYSNPELFNARIEGETSSRFYIKGSKKDLAISGNINTKKLSLKYGDISIEDASVNFPISMAYPRSKTLIRKPDIPETQYGAVQLKKFSYGPLEIEDVRINPLIISNNFFIKDSFKVPVFDGTIDIRNVSVENILNNDRKIKLGFQLNNISLNALTTTYKLTPFEGTLSSSIMSFHQQGQKLYSKDEINIKLFGGDLTIRDLTLNNFLKPMTEIGFSAEVKHLDLGKMSNTYREWGNITGIINGNIQDFKIVAGEPSSFDIEIKTENYPGIKQTVSTKFLKNFVPGIGKVLDKVGFTNYKYAVMGLHAHLENDYVKLRGAVREDGKELFMKGAGMKRLEIVFPNVDKRVPFKTFLSSFKGMLGSDIDDTQVQFK